MGSLQWNPTSLDVRASMKEPQYVNFVYYVSIVLALILFISVSILSSFAYGDKLEDVATLNLPLNNFTVWLRLIYCLCLLGSYPIQMIAPIDIIEQSDMYSNLPNLEWLDIRYYTVRTMYVLFTGILALIIPKIGLFGNFTGAIAGSIVWLIFPIMIYERVFQGQLGTKEYVIDRIILTFAYVFGGITIIVSFITLIILM